MKMVSLENDICSILLYFRISKRLSYLQNNHFKLKIYFVIKWNFYEFKMHKEKSYSLSLNLISMRNMRIVGNAIVFKIAIRTTSIAYVKPMSYKVCVAIAVVQEIAICLVLLHFLVIITIFVLVLPLDLFIININL